MRWPYKWRKKEGCPFKIPHLAGFIYKWDCFMENLYIKTCRLPKSGVFEGSGRREKVIVSLTSFPPRIEVCYYAIKSLMIQSYKADRIVLWLAEDQFPNRKLPNKYKKLIKRGLEIRYCKDLRSHKKYYFALQEQKQNELIITFDDDIIFERDAIKKLVVTHNKFPNCLICNRGHHITCSNQKLNPYDKWKICSTEGVLKPSMKILPSTGAGCLYPHGIMPQSTFDWELIKSNALTADDIWMCFNRVLAGTPAVKTREKIAILCNVRKSQKQALTQLNDVGQENQRTVERLLKIFPEVFKYWED